MQIQGDRIQVAFFRGRDDGIELRIRKKRDFFLMSSFMGLSARQMSTSGLMSISRRRCAERWVGLVSSSPAASM